MYNELRTPLQDVVNFIFVAGKFSMKIGKSNVKNPIIGRYSRGRRNKYNR